MIKSLTRLFELAGVGEGEEMTDLAMPGGTVTRCVKRGGVYVPVGRVSVYPTGLIARPPREELAEINRRLQGERNQQIRVTLQDRRKEITKRDVHNHERSVEMWANIQRTGLGDSVESVRAILDVLLAAGAAPTLSQEVGVPGSGGSLRVEPKWKDVGEGRRLLTTVITLGVSQPKGS